MARGGGGRRWGVLALGGVAAAMAAAVALTPMVSGARMAPVNPPVQSHLEGSGFDHNRAHVGSSPAARRREAARARRCADEGWRADNPAFCPDDAPTRAEARTAAAAGLDAAPQETTQPDGLWGPLLGVPSTAIHAVVMPTGKVLWFSQPKGPVEDVTDGGNAHVWDPVTNTSVSVPPPVVDYPADDAFPAYSAPANLWCAGQLLLDDGRVLVVGGNLAYPVGGNGAGAGAGTGFKGGAWVMTFDPWTEEWTEYEDMASGGRWYPTLTMLPDGDVLIVGGWDETGGVQTGGDPGAAPTMLNNQSVEVFDPDAEPGTLATHELSKLPPNGPGQPAPWPNHEGVGLYPHMFLLPDTTVAGAGGNKVLVAGPNQWDSAIIDTDTGIWTDVLNQPYEDGKVPLSSTRAWGTAWLEPSGPDGSRRVVLLGGSDSGAVAPGPGQSTAPLATAEVLDLDDPDQGWEIDPALALNTGRAHFNSVLLPGGGIFTNGGGWGRKDDSLYADPIFGAELLEPGAAGWRAVGNEADARTYHSTSVLLPDGRVVSAGDDRDLPFVRNGVEPVADHIALANRTAQLWSPPYLFDGARPAVTFAPQEVAYDAPFRVAVQGDPAGVAEAWLLRPGAVTHAVDMSQQAISLDVTTQDDGITMTSPLNATVAPPGYYMLFVLDGDGVPSVASWIRVHADAPPAPPLPVVPAPPPSAEPSPAPAPEPSTPQPAPAPPALGPLKVAVPAPALRIAGPRARVGLRLRAPVRATATVTISARGRKLASRRLALPARRTVRPAISVPRAKLGRARALTVRIVVRDAAGRRFVTTRAVALPRRR